MATQKELQERIARLEAMVEQLTGRPAAPEPEDPTERMDYVERGSDRHANILGLVKSDDEANVGGWALADPTHWIMIDPTGNLAKHVLRQSVSELVTPAPEVQSHDPRAPNYAPPMFRPVDFEG
jgi:hypothetical protein